MADINPYDVAIIGLGAMGSAALYQLSRFSGVRTAAFERETPGHDGGSSHGESRFIRRANFENVTYQPLIELAYKEWDRLSEASGLEIIRKTGIVEMGHPGSALIPGSILAAKAGNLEYEKLTGKQVRARYPAFRPGDDWIAVHQPDAGILRADHALTACIRLAQAAGATIRTKTSIIRFEPTELGTRLITETGEECIAKAVIVAAGPWMARQTPQITLPLRLTRQVFGWYGLKDPKVLTDTPLFTFDMPDGLFYGFPDFLKHGEIKVASHVQGEDVTDQDLNTMSLPFRSSGPHDVEALTEDVGQYLPTAVDMLLRTKTCLYTNTADEEFIIDRHPDHPNIVLLSPCSGHGFKFASAIGLIAAQMATGRPPPVDIGPYRLGR